MPSVLGASSQKQEPNSAGQGDCLIIRVWIYIVRAAKPKQLLVSSALVARPCFATSALSFPNDRDAATGVCNTTERLRLRALCFVRTSRHKSILLFTLKAWASNPFVRSRVFFYPCPKGLVSVRGWIPIPGINRRKDLCLNNACNKAQGHQY